jgi:hypothetical protein
LEGGRARIEEIEARTIDGSLIRRAGLDHKLEPNSESRYYIHLGIPLAQTGSAHCNGSPRHEYEHVTVDWADETHPSSRAEVICRRQNVSLKTGSETSIEGWESLPIARVKNVGSTPGLDPDYIPPLLNIQAWLPLRDGVIGRIRDLVKSRINSLAFDLKDVQIDGRGFANANLILFDRLNEIYTVLDLLARAEVHPFDAYLELARTLGRLMLFSHGKEMIEVERYDHDRLGPIFIDLRAKIISLLEPRAKRYLEKTFYGDGDKQLVVTFSEEEMDEWLKPEWTWILGVDRGKSREIAARQWLDGDNKVRWIVASKIGVDQCFRDRHHGLERHPCDHEIEELEGEFDRNRWSFWKLLRNKRDDAQRYSDIAGEKRLAMRFRIRDLEVPFQSVSIDVPAHGNQAGFQFKQFRLFAVRSDVT